SGDVDRYAFRLFQQEPVLLQHLFVLGDRLEKILGVIHHELGDDRDAKCGDHQRAETDAHKTGLHRAPPGAGPYAGKSRSLVRYTFSRKPSRMVIVGSTFKYRSRMRALDVARLA